MVFFLIYVILKCNLPPINTPKVISNFFKNVLALFLINSLPILYDLTFLGLKYSPLKMTLLKMMCLSTIWLKMSHYIRSVRSILFCYVPGELASRMPNMQMTIIILQVVR